MIIKHTGNAPKRAKPTDAGYDLAALEFQTIHPGKSALIRTGFAMDIPVGMAGLIMSRSGLALKKQVFVLNSPGLIDPGYIGDVGVILFNAGEESFDVSPGDKVAQVMFIATEHPLFVGVKELQQTERGTNGFGSTG